MNAVELHNVNVYYGEKLAVEDVNLCIPNRCITAFIGPSGCGKSTVLRCINRMNDLILGARVEGTVLYRGRNLYDAGVDPVMVRRRIGMVFQKPNPFPDTIFENVAYGLRLLGVRKRAMLEEIVERSLKKTYLWEEVKADFKKKSGLALSGGQQQRLCIARTIALEPEIVLMDEPASALDPISTQAIEELMKEIVREHTIVIVTHNMQQAQRVAAYTAFYSVRKEDLGDGRDRRWGVLVEFGETEQMFSAPQHEDTRRYVRGEMG